MENRKIAVLIDAENINYKNGKQIIDTMSIRGDVIIKEIIADWTKIKSRGKDEENSREKHIEGWRNEASKYSMTAIQQFIYVTGKNTCDMALTIKAMKILYEKPYITTFCLVSNDSDFTRLAQELREQNKEVIGMGERNKTIQEFVNAFSEFIYLGEALNEEENEIKEITADKDAEAKDLTAAKEIKQKTDTEKETKIKTDSGRKAKKDKCPIDREKLDTLLKTVEKITEDYEGVAYFSLISDRMKKQYPDFVPENYDCKNLKTLIEKLIPFLPGYEIYKEQIPNNPNAAVMMLRKKK